MREIEFLKLCQGDVVFNPGQPDDPWTVVGYQSRYQTFLLVRGRHDITRWRKWFWYFVAKLPERECLEIAESFDLRVARIINPANWIKEV